MSIKKILRKYKIPFLLTVYILLLSIILLTVFLTTPKLTPTQFTTQFTAKSIVKNYTLLPSLAGGLIQSNKNQRIDNYGKLKLTNKKMVNEDTTYIIGSCSKSMTATAIMKIFYEREPNNQDPMNLTISKVITTGIKSDYQNITLKQLLCMSSGINDTNFISQEFSKNFINNNHPLKTQRALLTKFVVGMESPSISYQPGEGYLYCNVGYVIAAHLVELYFNTTYEDIMNTYLFQPLNMSAQLPLPISPVNSPSGNNAVGHNIIGKDKEQYSRWLLWYKTRNSTKAPIVITDNTTAYVVDTLLQVPPPVIGAAGLIRLDMKSWLTYLEAVMMHNQFLPEEKWKILLNTGYKIDKKAKRDQLFGGQDKYYSFGWTYFINKPEILYYTGYIFTFTADVILKQHSFALATTTNSGRGDSAPSIPMLKLELALCPKNEQDTQNYLSLLIKLFPKIKNDPWISKS